MSRWRAFGVHFFISAVIFFSLLFFILFYWYPGVFINVGGWQGVRIVAGVDLVLGPLLTLLIFDIEKKSLKFDLAVIGLIQFSCLCAGVWLVYKERPLYQVLSDNGVYILNSSDFALYSVNRGLLPDFNDKSPQKIYLDLPEDRAQIEGVKTVTMFVDGLPLEYRFDLYRKLESNIETEKAVAWRLEKFELDKEKNCFQMPLYSSHLDNAAACFSLDRGVIDILVKR